MHFIDIRHTTHEADNVQEKSAWWLINNLLRESEADLLKNYEVYSLEERQQLLQLHQEIAAEYGLSNPYFKFAKTENMTAESEFLLNEPVREISTEFRAFTEQITIGRIGNFSAEDLAAIINDQIHVYVTQNTMGKFPKDDPKKVRELIAAMIDGFSEKDVFVSFQLQQKSDDGKQLQFMKPFAGAKLVFGSGEMSISQANGSPEATIPTLAALQITDAANLGELDEVLESKVVCASRLYSTVLESIPQIQSHFYPIFTAAYLSFAAQYYHLSEGATSPDWLLFDTHLDGLIKMVQRRFKGKVIASKDQVVPTELVSSENSILHYHYEGMQGEIRIGAIEMSEYVRLSKELLAKSELLAKLPLPIPQALK